MMPSSSEIIIGSPIRERVIFVGPFGVGKTTALRAISSIPVVSTEELSRERSSDMPDKTTTTVGLDYGEWHLPSGEPVGLLGLPGQARFDVMHDTLLNQSSAIVLWLFGNQKNSFEVAEGWLNTLAKRNALKKMVIALTRLPEPFEDAMLDAYRALLRPHHSWMPVISADPRREKDVVQAVAIALCQPNSMDTID